MLRSESKRHLMHVCVCAVSQIIGKLNDSYTRVGMVNVLFFVCIRVCVFVCECAYSLTSDRTCRVVGSDGAERFRVKFRQRVANDVPNRTHTHTPYINAKIAYRLASQCEDTKHRTCSRLRNSDKLTDQTATRSHLTLWPHETIYRTQFGQLSEN